MALVSHFGERGTRGINGARGKSLRDYPLFRVFRHFRVFSVFALLKKNSTSRGPHLLLMVYKKKGVFPSEHLEEPPLRVAAP
jgi:hypothetical protein